MKTIILFILIIVTSTVYSQTFNKIISNGKDQMPTSVIELNNGYFVSSIEKEPDDSISNTRLTRLSIEGEVEKTVFVNKCGHSQILRLEKISDTSFLSLSYYVTLTDSLKVIAFTTLNNNFDTLAYNEYKTEATVFHGITFASRLIGDNQWAFVAGFKSRINIEKSGLYFFVINDKCEIIKTNKSIRKTDFITATSIVQNYQKNGYLCFTYNFVYDLDSNLNIVDSTYKSAFGSPHSHLEGYLHATWKGESLYAGGQRIPPYIYSKQKMAVAKYNKDLTLHELKYFNAPVERQSTAHLNCFSNFNDHFYLIGNSDERYYLTFTPDYKNGIRTIKVDTNLNVIWDKVIESDGYDFTMVTLATSDGGVITASYYYNHETNNNYTDLHILKLDSLGNYIPDNVPEQPRDPLTAKVYPNPVTNTSTLTFSNPKNNTFHLAVYSVTGQVALARELTGGQVELKRGNFARGCYLYRLLGEQGEVITGKFVVE